MKKQRKSTPATTTTTTTGSSLSLLESLPEEILFAILSLTTPQTLKSISLTSKTLFSFESRHRKTLIPLRSDLLPAILSRYDSISHLDLTLCPRVHDSLLFSALSRSLKSIDLSRSRGFGGVGLAGLVARCEMLTEIDVSNGIELDDGAMAAIAGAKGLERLRMARCRGVTDFGIGRVAVGCCKLREWNLKWCFGISDLGVGLVAVKCKSLEILDLSYVPITSKCLPAILKLEHLKELGLSGCLGIDDEGLANIKQECKSLLLLEMSNCEHVSHVGLSSVTSGATNLQQLVLSYCFPISHTLASSIQNLSKLHSIKLDGCQITCSGLKTIGNSCLSLRELSLSKCSGVTDEALSYLVGKQKELEKLDITCCRSISDVSIASITDSCFSLTSLRMESCSLISKDAFVMIGQRCHLLEDLDFTDTELDDEGLKALSGCSKLCILKIGICLNISDDGLIYVGKWCKRLKELDLYRSVGITDIGVTEVALGCSDLEMINLAYCTEITDDSLRPLSNCSKLKALEIRGCVKVSSLGLSTIASGCKQITKLDIKKCHNINDIGMLALAYYCQNLKQINLSYCSVTDVGLLALANISCLQSMTILHVRGLSPNGLAVTLVACRGLTKVKLHTAFKFILPRHLITCIQARGCILQWRDKPFQVEVKPTKLWKLESEKIYDVVY